MGNSSRSYGVFNCCHCSRCSTELRDITLARQAPIRRALGGEAKDGGGPLPARSQAHRELVSAVSARAGSRAVDGTQAEAVGALCLFRHHRKFQSAPQLPAPGHRRVAEVVGPPLATGLDIVGGNAPAACALSATTAAHSSLHRHVAKPWAEEPDAGDPHVRIRGSLGGAIPWGDPTNLGNLWRRLALPMRIDRWSLTSLQQRLVKTRRPFDKACPVLLVAAGGEPFDAAAVCRHAAEDRGAAVAGGIRRVQSRAEQISMMTLGRRKKCLRSRLEKSHFRALHARQMRNRPLPAPLERPWSKPRLKTCSGRPFGLYG